MMCLCSCGDTSSTTSTTKEETPMNYINYLGRYTFENIDGKEIPTFSYSCAGFELKVNVKSSNYTFKIKLYSKIIEHLTQYINLYVDDVLTSKVELKNGYELVNIPNLSVGEHVIRINKLNEAQFTKIGLMEYEMQDVELTHIEKHSKRKMEVYGDSITCGYGNLASSNTESFSTKTEDGMQAYGALCAEELGFDYNIISESGIGMSMNPFGSDIYLGDIAKTADLVNPWDYQNYIPDFVVINIGTNDNTKYQMLKDSEKASEVVKFKENYLNMMKSLREAYGEDVKFVCIANTMINISNDLIKAIDEVIKEMNTLYDRCSFFYSFDPDNKGADGHPGLEAHKKDASILADFITMLDESY